MNPPVLMALAARYRTSEAGRSGAATRDFTIDYKDLLKAAEANDVDEREQAEKHLRLAEQQSAGLLSLDLHPRDERLIFRVRLDKAGGEVWLFDHLQLESPTTRREKLINLFREASLWPMTDRWTQAWLQWLDATIEKVRAGGSLVPLHRDDLTLNEELLRVIAGLLNWSGESLIRFASCVLCGDSKRLENLRGRIEQALQQITSGEVASLEALGILESPRQVLIHGPLQLMIDGKELDLGLLSHGFWISGADLERASSLETSATRCLSIENETVFHELAKLQTGILLVQTSFPNRAVRTFYQRLPKSLPCWHFGDADPAGYDILRDLRETTARSILPLHMRWRDDPTSAALTDSERQIVARLLNHPLMNDVHRDLESMRRADRKGAYEQEHLGWPKKEWPFYVTDDQR